MAPNGAIRRFRLSVVFVFAFLALGSPAGASDIQVCFTPEYGSLPTCTQRIVDAIGSAKANILVQAYSFTSAPIAKALVLAQRRGVSVKVLLDQRANTGQYSEATFLEHMSVPVSIDSEHATAHNKVIVIDDTTVITGSFNFTKAAEERNAENLLIIHDPVVAEQYIKNWKVHAGHSLPLSQPRANRTNSSANDNANADQDSEETRPKLPTGQIVGNQRSHIYAWPGCGSYDTMSPSNRVLFADAQAAEKAGYRPARNCP